MRLLGRTSRRRDAENEVWVAGLANARRALGIAV
jgi:hypothetical protein